MSLEVITGPMFSNKTSELLRRLSNASRVMRVLFINHSSDTRNNKGEYSTHNPLLPSYLPECIDIDCLHLESLYGIDVENYDMIGIDEAQWFNNLLSEVNRWVDVLGKKVIVAGLDTDFRRNAFGQIRDLTLQTQNITKLSSYCDECVNRGESPKRTMFNHRTTTETETNVVGGSDKYMAVCRDCWNHLNERLLPPKYPQPCRVFAQHRPKYGA